MSNLDSFDNAVDRNCGRLSLSQRARTGYYRQSLMDRSNSIKTKYQNMKKSADSVSRSSVGPMNAVGDALPPMFNSRRYNLGVSAGSVSMFSDTESEVDSERYWSDDELHQSHLDKISAELAGRGGARAGAGRPNRDENMLNYRAGTTTREGRVVDDVIDSMVTDAGIDDMLDDMEDTSLENEMMSRGDSAYTRGSPEY